MRLVCLLLMALAFAPSLAAATLTVSNLNDSGPGSLRDAITQANTVTGNDTIVFGAGVTGTIALSSSLPQVLQGGGSIDIQGPGRALLTISGANAVRIIDTQLASVLAMSKLTLSGGRAPLSGSDAEGGAIYSRGTLILFDVHITNCQANGANSAGGSGGSGRGGAICHAPAIANLSITNSLISNCWATGGSGGAGNGGDAVGGALFVQSGSGLFTQLTIQNCTATGGAGTAAGGAGAGAAIYANVPTTLIDSVIELCSALGGNGGSSTPGSGTGGGIEAVHSLSLTNVTLRSCLAQAATAGTGSGFARGGGVNVFGAPAVTPTVAIARCLIELCEARVTSGNLVDGGGLYLEFDTTVTDTHVRACNCRVGLAVAQFTGGLSYAAPDNITFERSTVSACGGGGLSIASSPAAVVINSTISGNNTGTGLNVSGATVNVSYSTITGNAAPGGATGGLNRVSGTVTMVGCIVAGNTSVSGAPDVSSGLLNGGNNLIGVQDSGAAFVNNVNGCKVGSAGTPLAALLGPLANNGGRTPTHALLTGSPAIDGGGAGAPGTDQREAPRNVGVADMGSYEFGAVPPNTGGQAGGEGDARCNTGSERGYVLLLLALLAACAVALRRRVA